MARDESAPAAGGGRGEDSHARGGERSGYTAAPGQVPSPAEFLAQLRPAGPWTLTAIEPDGGKGTLTRTLNDAASVLAFVAEHDGKRNIYYGINPAKTDVTKKASKAEIAQVEFLHADIDPDDDETPDQAKSRVITAITGFDHPTFVVDSGNGMQLLWRLQEPAGIDEAEARNRWLASRFGGDESTWDASRIFRLPGTQNLPNKKKRAKGRVECDARLIRVIDAAYPLEAFEAKAEARSKAKGGGSNAAIDLDEIIRTGDASRWGGDRSKAVWYVACEMLRRGRADAEVIATLVDRTNGISGHVHDQAKPYAYAEEQVEKAKAEVANEAAAMPPFERVVIVRAGEDTDWIMTVRGEEIRLTAVEVLNQKALIERCFTRLGVSWAPLSRRAWSTFLNRAYEEAEKRQDASLSKQEQFREQLEEWLTNRVRGSQRSDVFNDSPWEDEEKGRHEFQLRSLEAFLRRENSPFRHDTRPQIGARIERLGGGKVGKDGTTSIAGRSVRLWYVPSSAVQRPPEAAAPKIKETPV